MPSVNKVILVGNLTRDPQTRQLPTQNMVCEFGLAMNRKFKTSDGEDREEVCFIDCTAFGRQAEVIQKYCRKGKSIYLEGRLRYDSWEDKNGHGRRSKLTVVVENFQFLGARDDQPAGAPAQSQTNPRGTWDGGSLPERPAREKPADPIPRQLEFKEADIPF